MKKIDKLKGNAIINHIKKGVLYMYKKLEKIEQEIIEEYKKLAEVEIKQKYKALNNDYNKEVKHPFERIKDLVEQEDIEIDNITKQLGKMNPTEKNNNLQKLINSSINNKVFERIMKKVENNFQTISVEVDSEIEDEEELYQILNACVEYIEEVEFSFKKPQVDLDKACYFFARREFEQSEDYQTDKEILNYIYLKVFMNPDLERELIISGLDPKPYWISFVDLLTVPDEVARDYINALNNISAEIFYKTLINDTKNEKEKRINTAILRGCLYSFDERFFNAYQTKEIMGIFDEKLYKDTLSKSIEDRIKYPKIVTKEIDTETKYTKLSSCVKEYYEKLIALEIKKYNGEDTDFEFQKTIDILQMVLDAEDMEYKKRLNDYLIIDRNYGVFLETPTSTPDDLVLFRTETKFKSYLKTAEVNNQIVKEFGMPLERAMSNEVMEDEIIFESLLNSVFFLDEAIKQNEGKMREELIRAKYEIIYSNVGLEEVLLSKNFQVPMEYITVPDSLIRPENFEYEESGTNYAIESLYGILDTLNSQLPMDKFNFICGLSEMRGILYSLNEKVLQTFMGILDEVLDDEQLKEAPNLLLFIRTVKDMAINDRQKYKKLTFKTD